MGPNRLGRSSGRLMLGYLMIGIFMALRSKNSYLDNYRLKKIIQSTRWGISILTGHSLIISTASKAQNFAEIISFCTILGYSIWFFYFISVAKTAGALGILLHFKQKTGPLATGGLFLVMAAPVYTHWHNKDPFSDSYAAINQRINLSLLLVIYYFEKEVNSKPEYGTNLSMGKI